MKVDWARKLSSRKFWAAVGGYAASLLAALNVSDSVIARVTLMIAGVGALAAYILAEAYVDGKRAEQAAEASALVAGFDGPEGRQGGTPWV